MFSETDLIFTSIWPAVLIVLSVVLAVLHKFTRFKLVFGIAGGVVFAGSIIVLMALEANLADLLIYATVTCLAYVICGFFGEKGDNV